MKQKHPAVLFLLLTLSWSTSLSACSTNPPAGSASSGRHTPTVTTIATMTRKSTPTSIGGTLATQPPACPTPGTTRAANMPSDATIAQPAIFYLTGPGIGRFITRQDLIRYDLTTGKTTTIYRGVGGNWPSLPMPALSPDKHWLLFSSPGPEGITDNPSSRLLLMRTDGTQLQTLSCGIVLENQGTAEGRLIWSPDGQQVAFSGYPSENGIGPWYQTIHVLNLLSGQEKLYLARTAYAPYAWLDNQRLYVSQDVGDSPLDSARDFFLLDTSKGSNQKPESLVPIASTHTVCGNFTLSTDRQKVYSTTCSPTFGNYAGVSFHGPADVNERPATGGSSKNLFSHQDQAIVDIQTIDTKTALMYIVDTHAGCTQQNGLWEMNTETGSLNQLVVSSEDGNCSEELSYRDTSPQIANNSLSYALLVTSWVESTKSFQQTLQVGSLPGGAPTTITDMDKCACGLILVGMA